MPSFTRCQLINPRDSHLHRRIYMEPTTCSQPALLHNLKGDIRNKFDTSAYPRSALRTKRNLILDKPPDRISALAFCCWFTAIPSTLTSHTLARFPRISLRCYYSPLFFFFQISIFSSLILYLFLTVLPPPFTLFYIMSPPLPPNYCFGPSSLPRPLPHASTGSFHYSPQPLSLHLFPRAVHTVYIYISVLLRCWSALIQLVLNAGTTSSAYLNSQGSL